jgi:hypothetical protein
VPELVKAEDFTTRQKFVNVAPAMLAVGIIETLVIAGAPDEAPTVGRLLGRLEIYGWIGGAVLIVSAVVLVLLLEPLELATIRFMEGYWNPFGPLAAAAQLGLWLQQRRHSRLQWISDEFPGTAQSDAAYRKLKDFPDGWPLLPTSLGNTLRAMEEQAGEPYGLNSLTAWPRLYEALPEAGLKRMSEKRNALDTAARLCLSLALAAIISFGLLAKHGWWLLAPAGMLALAAIAYQASIAAARNYGITACAMFDVHRLKLLQLMRIEMPPSLQEELQVNKVLMKLWEREIARAPNDDIKYGRTDTDVGLHHQRSRPGQNHP